MLRDGSTTTSFVIGNLLRSSILVKYIGSLDSFKSIRASFEQIQVVRSNILIIYNSPMPSTDTLSRLVSLVHKRFVLKAKALAMRAYFFSLTKSPTFISGIICSASIPYPVISSSKTFRLVVIFLVVVLACKKFIVKAFSI